MAKALGFLAGSLLYAAISFYFLLMFALGDCAAHDETPPGHCWGEHVGFGTWASWSVGGYLFLTLGCWWLVRPKAKSQ